jgi:hypothetical protein
MRGLVVFALLVCDSCIQSYPNVFQTVTRKIEHPAAVSV